MGKPRRRIPVPYENATSGAAAREETTRLLHRLGCESVGFMDEFAEQAVLLAFAHRGRHIKLRASAKGWAALWLKANPYHGRMRCTVSEHQQRALRQGLIAVNSIIRDWVKGQVTAVECGLMPFEAVFVPYMVTSDGRTVLEHLEGTRLLPPPQTTTRERL